MSLVHGPQAVLSTKRIPKLDKGAIYSPYKRSPVGAGPFQRRRVPLGQESTDLDKAFTDSMQQRLATLKKDILTHLAQEDAEFRELWEDMDPKDLVDVASEDVDRKTLDALGAQEMRRLNLIESALARIPNGHYGVCMKCGARIPRERLEAIPYALLCIGCQSSEERRNR